MLPSKPRPTAVDLMRKLSAFGLKYLGDDLNRTFTLSRLGTCFKVDGVTLMYDPKRRPLTQMWLSEAVFQAERDAQRPAVVKLNDHQQWRIWLQLSPREFAHCQRALAQLHGQDQARKGKSTHP